MWIGIFYPAFSQEILVDFEEAAHAKTEDVTK